MGLHFASLIRVSGDPIQVSQDPSKRVIRGSGEPLT